MGQPLFLILKFSWSSLDCKWRSKGFTQLPKLGSATRCSNELLTENSLKETPNSSFSPYLRDFKDNSVLLPSKIHYGLGQTQKLEFWAIYKEKIHDCVLTFQSEYTNVSFKSRTSVYVPCSWGSRSGNNLLDDGAAKPCAKPVALSSSTSDEIANPLVSSNRCADQQNCQVMFVLTTNYIKNGPSQNGVKHGWALWCICANFHKWHLWWERREAFQPFIMLKEPCKPPWRLEERWYSQMILLGQRTFAKYKDHSSRKNTSVLRLLMKSKIFILECDLPDFCESRGKNRPHLQQLSIDKNRQHQLLGTLHIYPQKPHTSHIAKC